MKLGLLLGDMVEVTPVVAIAVAIFPKGKTNNEKTNKVAMDRVWTEFSFGLLPQVIDRRGCRSFVIFRGNDDVS